MRLLICDLRPAWDKKPYITFWRPDNKGYAFPLSWAGDYTEDQIFKEIKYYIEISDIGELVRFAVPRDVAEAMAIAPKPGWIDNDAGPVVLNKANFRAKLRKNAYIPTGVKL